MKQLLSFLLAIGSLLNLHGQQDTVIHVNGADLHYRTFGEGTPILIINGGPGMNSEGFSNLAELLADGHEAILYDQRGTGQSHLSPLDSNTITMDLMVGDIEALRHHLGLDQWVVLGHSFGGILASYYATQHPESFSALILSSSGGIDLDLLNYFGDSLRSKLTAEEQRTLTFWSNRIGMGDTSYNAKLQRGLAMAPAYVYHKEFVPAIGQRLAQGNMVINGLVWNDLARIGYNCAPKLTSFKQPVLIIQGKQDLISIETAEKAHSVLSNSEVVVLDKCGHYGWLDQKEKYLSAIYTFLERME